jgi:hypothetical protein
MSKLAKALTAAAGNAGGESLYVEDVFSTYLYEGNSSTQTITNGIDLDGEGGLVWLKIRPVATSHVLVDTERGASSAIFSDSTDSEQTGYPYVTSFNSDGFTLGNMSATNDSSYNYASWTFRKAKKFFDVVTYTGNGTTQEISHNLGSTPACIIVKNTQSSTFWAVYHGSIPAFVGFLNATNAFDTSNTQNFGNNTSPVAPTDSVFTVGQQSLVNSDGETYVAYLFASDAGGFGDDGDESIIKCGSFTTDSSAVFYENLGFEPQWVLVKRSDGTSAWNLLDNMRGFLAEGIAGGKYLRPNTNGAEGNLSSTDSEYINATGFGANGNGVTGSANATFIYIAIRRPMKTPESGTEVFDLGENLTSIGYQTIGTIGPIDMCMSTQVPTPYPNYHWAFTNRLVGGDKFLASAYTQAEASSYQEYDTNTGVINKAWFTLGGLWYNFKRATGFFDVVAYTGDGTTEHQITHNLGVTPEMIIVKRRSAVDDWLVCHKDQPDLGDGTQYNGRLNSNSFFAFTASNPSVAYFGIPTTGLTSTYFTTGALADVNASGSTYISYLFATLTGVSKVGSYTGTGADLNVDCGFSAGARFILIKRRDSTGDWYVWDSVRGIVAGNDPYLLLNSTAAEVTSTDYIDPLSSGFTVTSSAPAALNASGGTYIFLAIA